MENIEKELYQAAIELVNMRYPSGWGGAAAVRTESGKILTSIAPDIKTMLFHYAWKWVLI